MVLPRNRRWAAAMVDGDEESGRAAILRQRLGERPELSDETIELTRGFEVTFVVAFVRPVVGLAEGDVHRARFERAHRVFRGVAYKRIEDNVAPNGTAPFGHFGQRVRHRQPSRALRHFPGTPDRKATA